ncbi:Rrf2 family transcriptional regulator [Candidatus Gracilibacteria bacterium]|nr:Rrf2 family transcriptional regulator [Candidatus Gracilibacteria bacterium]
MIKLSKTGDSALKAICYIADHAPEIIQIRDISAGQGISESHLRLIIADLNNAGILRTIRGRNGGVQLAQSPSTLSVFDILQAVGEELGITDCTKDIYCEKKSECYTTDVLGNLQKGFNSLLKIHTLDKIIQTKKDPLK